MDAAFSFGLSSHDHSYAWLLSRLDFILENPPKIITISSSQYMHSRYASKLFIIQPRCQISTIVCFIQLNSGRYGRNFTSRYQRYYHTSKYAKQNMMRKFRPYWSSSKKFISNHLHTDMTIINLVVKIVAIYFILHFHLCSMYLTNDSRYNNLTI